MSNGPTPNLDVLAEQVRNLRDELRRHSNQLERIERGGFLTREEFNRYVDRVDGRFTRLVKYDEGRYWLVERLVFGGAGVILLTALIAILVTIGWRPAS